MAFKIKIKQTSYNLGDEVETKTHGRGVVTDKAVAAGTETEYEVLHVKLGNGEVRHFTVDDIK